MVPHPLPVGGGPLLDNRLHISGGEVHTGLAVSMIRHLFRTSCQQAEKRIEIQLVFHGEAEMMVFPIGQRNIKTGNDSRPAGGVRKEVLSCPIAFK